MENLFKIKINQLRHDARCVVRELGLLNDAYFDIGVTLAERHLLIELCSSLYPTMGEIAEKLLLDKSTVSRLISKAVKKGYIKCISDENDKRKKFLQLTGKGKKTLHAFEPIAFNQTREALLTLTSEEIETVYRGIALYAQGLRKSRLQNKISITKLNLKDHTSLAHLMAELNKEHEWDHLLEMSNQKSAFYFVMKLESKMIGGVGITPYLSSKVPASEISKLYIQPAMHNFGFEKLLLDFCLNESKKLGYKKSYLNSEKENLFSKECFQKLGFQNTKNNKYGSLLWKAC